MMTMTKIFHRKDISLQVYLFIDQTDISHEHFVSVVFTVELCSFNCLNIKVERKYKCINFYYRSGPTLCPFHKTELIGAENISLSET